MMSRSGTTRLATILLDVSVMASCLAVRISWALRAGPSLRSKLRRFAEGCPHCNATGLIESESSEEWRRLSVQWKKPWRL